MWTFLSDNADGLNVVINFLMLIVWALYFQLLLNAHHRQRRAKVLINRSAGHTLNANCIISNMGGEPIYLEAVIVEYREGDADRRLCLTDLETLTSVPERDARPEWFQGPLANGDYINLGSFRHLLDAASDDNRPGPGKSDAFALIVVASNGAEDVPIAARRLFRKDDGAETWHAGPTQQVRSRPLRRELAAYMRGSE